MRELNSTARKTLAVILIGISILLFSIIFGYMLKRGIGEVPKFLAIGAFLWFVRFIWQTFVPRSSNKKKKSETVEKKLHANSKDDAAEGDDYVEADVSKTDAGEMKHDEDRKIVGDATHLATEGAKGMQKSKYNTKFIIVLGVLLVAIFILITHYWLQNISKDDNEPHKMPIRAEVVKDDGSVERYITIKNKFGRYPEFSSGALSEQYLDQFSEAEGLAIKNEVYARRGMMFYDSSLQRYYESQEWYYPVYINVSKKVSNIERFNLRKFYFQEDWGSVEPQYLDYVVDEEMDWEMGFPKGWTLLDSEYDEPTLRKKARVEKAGKMVAEILVFVDPDAPISTVEKEVIYSQLRDEGVTPTEYGQRYLAGMKYYYVKGSWRISGITYYGIFFFVVSQKYGYIVQCVTVSPGRYNDIFYECFYSFREMCR